MIRWKTYLHETHIVSDTFPILYVPMGRYVLYCTAPTCVSYRTRDTRLSPNLWTCVWFTLKKALRWEMSVVTIFFPTFFCSIFFAHSPPLPTGLGHGLYHIVSYYIGHHAYRGKFEKSWRIETCPCIAVSDTAYQRVKVLYCATVMYNNEACVHELCDTAT